MTGKISRKLSMFLLSLILLYTLLWISFEYVSRSVIYLFFFLKIYLFYKKTKNVFSLLAKMSVLWLYRMLHFTPTMVDCISEEPLEILPHNKPVPRRERKAWNPNAVTESSKHRKDSFAKIYKQDIWGGTKSGPGSLLVNAGKIISVLDKLVVIIKEVTGKDKLR
jgi:hypothetical protein